MKLEYDDDQAARKELAEMLKKFREAQEWGAKFEAAGHIIPREGIADLPPNFGKDSDILIAQHQAKLIADIKESERLMLDARRFLNELRMVYRPCWN